MSGVVLLIAIVVFVAFILGIMSSTQDDPRNHATGRWGVKTGKFISGDWGGDEWGSKPKKK